MPLLMRLRPVMKGRDAEELVCMILRLLRFKTDLTHISSTRVSDLEEVAQDAHKVKKGGKNDDDDGTTTTSTTSTTSTSENSQTETAMSSRSPNVSATLQFTFRFESLLGAMFGYDIKVILHFKFARSSFTIPRIRAFAQSPTPHGSNLRTIP